MMTTMWSSVTPVLLPLLLVLFLSLQSHVAAKTLEPAMAQRLGEAVREIWRCSKMAAVSMSVVRLEPNQDDLVWEFGFGNPKGEQERAITTPQTQFCLGSSTQAFTAVLLADLLPLKNATFDTPLQDILGRVDLPGRFRPQNVNLKDIFGMRTGLSNMDIKALVGFEKYEYLRALRYAPEVKGFREDNVFSEAPFALVEEAVNVLGDSQWYNLVRQHLLLPLDIKDVSFAHHMNTANPSLALPVVDFERSADPVRIPPAAYKGLEPVASAASICASANDMTKWMTFILKKSSRPGKDETVTSTFKAVNFRANGGDPRVSGFDHSSAIPQPYIRNANALGWIKGNYRGSTFVSMDGSLPGFESLTTIIPSRNIGVFVAFTGAGGAKAYAAKVLLNTIGMEVAMNSYTNQDWCSLLSRLTEEVRKFDPVPAPNLGSGKAIRELSEYAHTYRNYGFGNVEVKVNNDSTPKLVMTYGKEGQWVLHPSHVNDTFFMNAQGSLWYTTNADDFRKSAGQFLAKFETHDSSDDHIISVSIPHFAKDTEVVFSRQPGPPPHSSEHLEFECQRNDACASLISSASVLVASILLSWVTGRFR